MSMERLQGKTALVTAAGQGIGRAAAERLAAEGATVWATDIDRGLLSGLSVCRTEKLDVTRSEEIDALVRKAGPLDILFNCAGMVASGTILDCTDEDWRRSFDLNVTAMYRVTKEVLPPMISAGGGSIINMSSVASSVKGVPNRFAYSASKAAVIGMTKAVAADFIGQGVRCNAICPGTIDTPSLHERLRATGDYDSAWSAFVARQPIGRIGKPEEIAALVAYLASDEARFTTGQIHVIDGGWAL
jgi:2-keto-3-deoxy-L-fuconate dehydrogenase